MPRAKKPKPVKTKKIRDVKYNYGQGQGTTVSSDNYHPDSIAYMNKKLGRRPTPEEAVKLDREWASKKLDQPPTGEALRLLMGESTSQPSGRKRSLASRQLQDFIDTGKADLQITEPNYNVKPMPGSMPKRKKKQDDGQEDAQAV